jgi:hypothetical protein
MQANAITKAKRHSSYARGALFLAPIILGGLFALSQSEIGYMMGAATIIGGFILSGWLIGKMDIDITTKGKNAFYSENIPTEVNHLSKKKSDINDAIKKLEGIPFKIADSIMK